VDFAHLADTEGMRRIKRRRSHQNGGKADQAVKASDQLRHRCHRDLAGDVGTRAAADGETRYDQHKSAERRLRQEQCRDDGDCHADHAVEVALPAGSRMRQAPERHDEKNA
jgi:hypothetical protein